MFPCYIQDLFKEKDILYDLRASKIRVQPKFTLDDSHRTGTTEIVQAIKSGEENIDDNKEMKIWDQIMYL